MEYHDEKCHRYETHLKNPRWLRILAAAWRWLIEPSLPLLNRSAGIKPAS